MKGPWIVSMNEWAWGFLSHGSKNSREIAHAWGYAIKIRIPRGRP